METNGLNQNGMFSDAYHASVTRQIKRYVSWAEAGLRITRLRLLSDRGFPVWDVSYCHGFIKDEPVRVRLPFGQLPKDGMFEAIIEAAKADRVYAKGLGLFEKDVISTLNV